MSFENLMYIQFKPCAQEICSFTSVISFDFTFVRQYPLWAHPFRTNVRYDRFFDLSSPPPPLSAHVHILSTSPFTYVISST